MHTPVLASDVASLLNLKSKGIYVDATVGSGGHVRKILEKIKDIQVVAIDQDESAIKLAKENIEDSSKIIWVNSNFSNIRDILYENKIRQVDGIYADLGMSSMQLSPERGFSFKEEGPLDMRMDTSSLKNLKDFLLEVDEKELANIIYEYGEEGFSRRIAKKIKCALAEGSLKTTRDLAELIKGVYPPKLRYGRKKPEAKTFQALRIWVNQELKVLDVFLKRAPELLNEGGVLVIISYHSLEDRRVKHTFRSLEKEGGFKVLTKRPVVPTDAEISQNPKARSAKLRALIKQQRR